MLTAIGIAAAIVAALALAGWLMIMTVESGRPWPWIVALLVLITAFVSAVIYFAQKDEAKGPCLQTATGYVMSGKVLVPYTYCTERGTWATPSAGASR